MQEGTTQASLAHFVSPTAPGTIQVAESKTTGLINEEVQEPAAVQMHRSGPDSSERVPETQEAKNLTAGQSPHTTQCSEMSEVLLGSDTQALLARMSTPDIPTGQLMDLDTDKINKLGAPHAGPRTPIDSHVMHNIRVAPVNPDTGHATASWTDADQDSFPPASAGQVHRATVESGAFLRLFWLQVPLCATFICTTVASHAVLTGHGYMSTPLCFQFATA